MKGKGVCPKRKISGFVFIVVAWTTVVYAQGLSKIPVYFNNQEVWVEVAKTAEDRARGLMGRKDLGEDQGMLFVFETEGYHNFWMKNTLIPLSIAFMDREGKILRITDMKPLTLESHGPPEPVLFALEMKKGWFDARGIRVGHVMRFSK
jgi:uncharacterized membrane protein (UPF0127 family)